MRLRKTRVLGLWLSAFVCALSGTAQAGPVEILNSVSISRSHPDNLIVSYVNGNNGLFVSQDGGKTLKWLCSAGAALEASNRNMVTFASGDGSIYLGMYGGLMRGDANGCGFQFVPELEKKSIRGITGDPFEPTRTYAITTNAMVDNGIYMREGEGEFAAFGAQIPKFLASLHVVKNGSARRFYVTAIATNLETNKLDNTVRVSDDEGATWTEEPFDPAQFETPDKKFADFKIVAIDPTNPDTVVAHLERGDKVIDTLLFSRSQGKAGSWERLAAPVELGGIAFTTDGTLYFGDNNFETKGLYKVSQLGGPVEPVSDAYRISCVSYDDDKQRLLVCADFYRFGEFDTATGVLSTLLDLRCADHVVECADKPELRATCSPTMGVEFCALDHWVLAPLCCVYPRDGLEVLAASQSITCEGDVAVSKPEGGGPAPAPTCALPLPAAGTTATAAGSGGSSGGSGGSSGGSGGAAAPPAASGCGCSAVGDASRPRLPMLALTLGLIGLCGARLRRRR